MTRTFTIIIGLGAVIVAGALLINRIISMKEGHDRYRIAIFEPAIHNAIDEISKGFIDTLSRSGERYSFTRYNANGNKIIMRSQAEEILHQEYDLIFTIGGGCSLMVKELCNKQRSVTPVVFTAIDNSSLMAPFGATITGVRERTNYPRQLELLMLLKPAIRTVLLVYDPSQGTGLEKDKEEIRSIVQSTGRALIAVEIQSPGEVQQKISALMEKVDAIMILKDHTAVSSVDSLVMLCNRYHIPLLASDLNSSDKGAVFAYGIKENKYGVYAAKKAQLILAQKKKPVDIPVTSVDEFLMKINRKQAVHQGIVLNDAELDKLPDLSVE